MNTLPETSVERPVSRPHSQEKQNNITQRQIIVGQRGPIGPRGPPGMIGPTGARGIPGTSVKGVTGARGFIGPTGARGIPGIGVKGDQGDQGEIGPIGPHGEIGLRGLRGVQGIQGIDGKIGPTGATGANGPPGLRGVPGVAGIQGEIGPTGPKGSNEQNLRIRLFELIGFDLENAGEINERSVENFTLASLDPGISRTVASFENMGSGENRVTIDTRLMMNTVEEVKGTLVYNNGKHLTKRNVMVEKIAKHHFELKFKITGNTMSGMGLLTIHFI